MTMTAHATRATNVLAFPKITLAGSPKPRLKIRQTKCANVLNFTAKKIRHIDGPACLPEWKKTMVDQLTQAIGQVLRDEITGLLLAKTMEFPVADKPTEGTVVACGAFGADFGLLGRQGRWIEDKARELAEDAPVRWV